eukprot:CAMPEP_0172805618 /NCGR_PEP_ID=MMETSP1075-20121228/5854_1 /TAXON_ID=2916 /ORGANISM="Ceratium fusus, Strain PA161109" /LENGTH=467 /DNA_ID=CAMNT_0013644311 /DNA_START=176 /DNA_END=1579 /DNA_ORIENTATION=+
MAERRNGWYKRQDDDTYLCMTSNFKMFLDGEDHWRVGRNDHGFLRSVEAANGAPPHNIEAWKFYVEEEKTWIDAEKEIRVSICTQQELEEQQDDGVAQIAESIAEASSNVGVACAFLHFSPNPVVQVGAGGLRQINADVKAEADDAFIIASCTKSMTATLCGIFVQEGHLAWDSTVEGVLGITGTFGAVTLHELLTHQSRMPRPWKKYNTDHVKPPDPEEDSDNDLWIQRRRQLIEGVLAVAEPYEEEGFHYSNLGYIVVACMLEEVSKLRWEELMMERLFEPLGITTGVLDYPGRLEADDDKRAEYAWPHKGSPPVPIDPKDVSVTFGAPVGGCCLSVADWARYLAVHVDYGWAHSKLGLVQETMVFLHAPFEGSSYACGWHCQVSKTLSHGVLFHDGLSSAGPRCWVRVDLGLKVAAMYICNGKCVGKQAMSKLMRAGRNEVQGFHENEESDEEDHDHDDDDDDE